MQRLLSKGQLASYSKNCLDRFSESIISIYSKYCWGTPL